MPIKFVIGWPISIEFSETTVILIPSKYRNDLEPFSFLIKKSLISTLSPLTKLWATLNSIRFVVTSIDEDSKSMGWLYKKLSINLLDSENPIDFIFKDVPFFKIKS